MIKTYAPIEKVVISRIWTEARRGCVSFSQDKTWDTPHEYSDLLLLRPSENSSAEETGDLPSTSRRQIDHQPERDEEACCRILWSPLWNLSALEWVPGESSIAQPGGEACSGVWAESGGAASCCESDDIWKGIGNWWPLRWIFKAVLERSWTLSEAVLYLLPKKGDLAPALLQHLQNTLRLHENASAKDGNWAKSRALLFGMEKDQGAPSLPGALEWA